VATFALIHGGGGITPTPSVTAATWSRLATPSGVHCAAGLCPRPRRPRGAARGDDPASGELFTDWWSNNGYRESGYEDVFYHDIAPEARCRGATARTGRESPGAAPAVATATSLEVQTKYLLCGEDRMFPVEWACRHARARLGIEPDEIDGGHCVTLSRPRMLVDRLAAYVAGAR
jgi:hypothetical protein